jgi:hypothetical protein
LCAICGGIATAVGLVVAISAVAVSAFFVFWWFGGTEAAFFIKGFAYESLRTGTTLFETPGCTEAGRIIFLGEAN